MSRKYNRVQFVTEEISMLNCSYTRVQSDIKLSTHRSISRETTTRPPDQYTCSYQGFGTIFTRTRTRFSLHIFTTFSANMYVNIIVQ